MLGRSLEKDSPPFKAGKKILDQQQVLLAA